MDEPPKSGPESKELCKDCSECCSYIVVEIPAPKTKEEYDDIVWYLVHQNVQIYIDFEGKWNLEFRTPCIHLTKEGLCGIYEERPNVCKNYSHKVCEKYNHNPYYYVLMKSKEDLFKYIEEAGIKFE